MYFVYELFDPRTSKPGYIGITNNPNQRLLEHLELRAGKGKKNAWIQQLLAEQVEPKMKILEIVEDRGEAQRRERYWIQQYLNRGIQLTNHLLVSTSDKPTSKPTREEKLTSRAEVEIGIDAISASEAKKQLGIDSGRFNYWVKKGLIEQVARQGKIVYYKKSDVDALEAQIEALLLAGTSEEAMAVYRERYHN